MKNKFTKNQNMVLCEIYRRLNYFHNGNLNEDLMYLGFPTEANKLKEFNLIEPFSKEIARALNWYKLTDIGKSFFSNYVTVNKLSDRTNSAIFNGNYIKIFDKSFLPTN